MCETNNCGRSVLMQYFSCRKNVTSTGGIPGGREGDPAERKQHKTLALNSTVPLILTVYTKSTYKGLIIYLLSVQNALCCSSILMVPIYGSSYGICEAGHVVLTYIYPT